MSDYPPILLGSPEYNELVELFGPAKCRTIVDESVRQINQRWLKADIFQFDHNGEPILHTDRNGYATIRDGYGVIATRSHRIRIPRGSMLRHRTRS